MVVSGECISGLGRNVAAHVRNILSRELASLTLGDAGGAAIVDRSPDGAAGIGTAGHQPSPTTAVCALRILLDTSRAHACSPERVRFIGSRSPAPPFAS